MLYSKIQSFKFRTKSKSIGKKAAFYNKVFSFLFFLIFHFHSRFFNSLLINFREHLENYILSITTHQLRVSNSLQLFLNNQFL
ncbi:hypothetical protein LEP1GSC062_1609 [Leptospira alexanderi serovar Manhao 3 str. L 60]|uniref:Uncharacterized protein n=1 Tax=Leptospira alexanderi serovar Manhao 3 str. L 60 TaxID=1049759 RepID=V6HV39_9LEPT|nr:hypothetical protein LEP1GSC062_1609 [Leptospira alexanderi serovar Manhao 3 str. L 60]